MRTAIQIVVVVTGVLPVGDAIAAKPFFKGLGMLGPDSINSGAGGVSADGSVVVGVVNTQSSQQAFRWTLDEGMQGLGFFPGADSSYANKVSDDGTIVGVGQSANGQQGFIWTPENGIEGIGFVPGVDVASYAYTISGDGKTVVGSALNNESNYEMIRWTREEGIVLLGDLPGGEFNSGAVGVSQDGSIILGFGRSTQGAEMLHWTAGSGLVGLGDAPPSDFYASLPTDLSADGTTSVGYAAFSGPSVTLLKAVRWTNESGFVDLGQLPGGLQNVAWAVSGDGSVIVGEQSFPAALYTSAFFWTDRHGIQSLQEFLETRLSLADSLSGWTLTHALDVSTDGKSIVGEGVNPEGKIEAWIARIPEPSTIDLTMTATAAVVASALVRGKRLSKSRS